MTTMWFLFHNSTREQFQNLTEQDLSRQLKTYKPGDLNNLFVWNEQQADWKALKDIPELQHIVAECFQTVEKKSPPLPPPPFPQVPSHFDEITQVNEQTRPTKTATNPTPIQVAQDTIKDETKIQTDISRLKVPPAKFVPTIDLPPPNAQQKDFDSSITNTSNLNIGVSADHKEIDFSQRRQHPRYPIKLRVLIRSKELTFRTFTSNISLGGVALEHPIPEAFMNKSCQILIAGNQTEENIRFTLKLVENKGTQRVQFEGNENGALRLRVWIEKYIEGLKAPKTA